MTGFDEGARERVVGAFVVAFAVGVTAGVPAVVLGSPGGDGIVASAGVAVGVGLVVAAGVRQTEDLLDSFAPVRWLLVPGVGVVAWTLAAFVVRPPVEPVALAPFGVAFAGCVFGVAAWVLARDAYDRARRDAATTVAAFEASIPPRVRRIMLLAGVVTTAATVVVVVTAAILDDVVLALVFFPLSATGGTFVMLSRFERDVRVTEEALYVQRSRRDWADFEAVRVADDVLVVDGRTWKTGTLRFDATDIQDVAGVVAAIRARIEEANGQSSPDS